jgi:hypothetical protein
MIYVMHVEKVKGINSQAHYLEAFEDLDDYWEEMQEERRAVAEWRREAVR